MKVSTLAMVSRRGVVWFSMVTCLVGSGSTVEARETPREQFEAGLGAYYEVRFDDAAIILEEFVARPDVGEDERIEGYLYLAKSYWGLTQTSEVRTNLEAIHRLDPEYVPDMRKILDIQDIYFDVFGASLADEPGVHTIAILDFTNDSIGKDRAELDGLETGMAHMLITDLGPALNVRVVERERLDHVLREIELSKTGMVDPETAVRAGNLLGAQSMLMGGFMKLGDKVRIDVRLVITETSEIKPLQGGRIEGDWDDLLELIPALVEAVAEEIGGVLESEGSQEQTRPSVEALRALGAGIDAVNRGEIEEAVEDFQAALDAHPGYQEAEVYLAEIQPILMVSR